VKLDNSFFLAWYEDNLHVIAWGCIPPSLGIRLLCVHSHFAFCKHTKWNLRRVEAYVWEGFYKEIFEAMVIFLKIC
jgi:hypothetical protein